MALELNTRRDFERLFDLLKRDAEKDLDLIVSIDFLEPIHVLVLAWVLLIYRDHGLEVNIECTDVRTVAYIEALKLEELGRQETGFLANAQFGAMPIIRLEIERMPAYIAKTQEFFQANCPGKDLTMLDSCLAELLNNAYEHSQSEYGALVFSQYYPNINCIKIAVADLGIGIPESVNKFLRSKGDAAISDCDAIQWAVEKDKTTQSHPQNRGFGLDNIRSFVGSGDHYWFLYSGDGALSAKGTKIQFEQNPLSDHFGTMAQLNIMIDNLSDREEAVEEFDIFG